MAFLLCDASLIRWGDRFHFAAVTGRLLRELTDMIEIAGGSLKVVVVHIAANRLPNNPTLPKDPDFSAIRNAKQILIIRSDEADPPPGIFHMLLQPGSVMAITIYVVVVDPSVGPQEIAVFLCVSLKTEICEVVGSKGAFRMGKAVL